MSELVELSLYHIEFVFLWSIFRLSIFAMPDKEAKTYKRLVVCLMIPNIVITKIIARRNALQAIAICLPTWLSKSAGLTWRHDDRTGSVVRGLFCDHVVERL